MILKIGRIDRVSYVKIVEDDITNDIIEVSKYQATHLLIAEGNKNILFDINCENFCELKEVLSK